MGEVSRALQSLSRTMRDRGGIVDARLKGADALLGMKKLEYDIGQGEKASSRAERSLGIQESREADRKSAFTSGAAGRALKESTDKTALREEERLNQKGRLNIKQIYQGNYHGIISALTKGKDGKNFMDYTEEGIPGVEWDDETGDRLDSKGNPIMMSTRDWEQKYKPAVTLSYLASTDPMRYMEGKSWELDQQLKEMDPKSPDYAKVKKQADAIKTTMGDRAQLATLYGGQAAKVRQGLLWASTNNADPNLIRMLEQQVSRTEGLFKEYKATMTPAEKAKYDKQMKLLDKQIKVAESKINKNQDKEPKFDKSKTEYEDECAEQKILGSIGIGVDQYGMPNREIIKQELDTAMQLGSRLGYEIQSVPGELLDKKGWGTGDEQMYKITGINRINMPGGSMGLSAQPTPPPAPKLATDGNYYLPDPNRPGKYLKVEQDTGTPKATGGDQLMSSHGLTGQETSVPKPAQAGPEPYGELSQSEEEMAQQVEQAKRLLINAGYKAIDIAAWPGEKLIQMAQTVMQSPNPRKGLTRGVRSGGASGEW